jgi:hypothetical protein
MSRPSTSSIYIQLVAAVFTFVAIPSWGVSFQPVSPEELKMTSEPKAPGAPAIILYREVNRDDRGHTAHEDVYFRIKILTEEGRKYADIEIPFWKEQGNVVNVHARTIKPDGTIINYSGKVFDKSIAKARGVKYMAKTFTLPDVQVGCVLEYYYTTDFDENYVFDSHWILSDELFTKSAKFSLNPFESDQITMNLRWLWHNLPVGTGTPSQDPMRIVHLQVSDVPAFHTEDFMPPENEMKARVDFIYSEDAFEKEPDTYWKKLDKRLNDRTERFVGRRKAMEEAVAGIVSASDSPEVKLQKLYARVQQIRNTTFEVEKTEQEQKREKEKVSTNVEEVWKKQYGSGLDLTWLFLGLARAAGFESHGMFVPDRRNYFFYPSSMDGRRLDEAVVVVKLNGKDIFFDPGTIFIPFGMLPWIETGVSGLKLDKDGGSWLQTTLPESNESAIQRKADLKLSDTGDLEGKLTLTFTGLEAAQRRTDERLSDDADRKKYLEDEVKSYIPTACEVELTNKPEWKSSSPAFVAEFNLKIPGWLAAAGRRGLLPVALFGAPERHLFDHSERVHPIYFEFPFERLDDVTIDLSGAWQITTLPPPQNLDVKAITYNLGAENDKGSLHLKRVLNVDIMYLPQDKYAELRHIFQTVRTGDEQQVILQPGGTTAHN